MGQTTETESRLRDELLVVRCQLGEREALDELICAWSDPLLRHVQRIAGSEIACDIVQEVWLRALKGIARLRDGARLRPWLFGIAHHVMMDRLRARYAEREALYELENGPDAQAEESPEVLSALLESRLATLPALERETLSLFYFQELSLVQVAEVQEVPIGTVKSRLFRARALLRQSMLEEMDHG